MLKGILNSSVQNGQLNQALGVDKTGLFEKTNPYSANKSGLLVDGSDISTNAMQLYQKELDLKQFTDLTLSDPSDTSHNSIVASKLESGDISFDDEDIINSLFNNPEFISDIFA